MQTPPDDGTRIRHARRLQWRSRARWAAAVLVAGMLAALGVWRLVPRVPELGACTRAGRSSPPTVEPADPPPRPEGVPDGTQAAVVVRVVDGDGICVRPAEPGLLAEGGVHEVRLIGINAPGTGACGSDRAAGFARRRIGEGTSVWLSADQRERDRYGRFLRYAWDAAGESFNLAAVREGYARALPKPPNERYTGEIEAAETAARRASRGVWRCLPWRFLRWLPL
jgi:endonuclease YncB( thermonuclease family)